MLGLLHRPRDHDSPVAALGRRGEQVDGARQVRLEGRQDERDLPHAGHVACQMDHDVGLDGVERVAHRARIGEVELPPADAVGTSRRASGYVACTSKPPSTRRGHSREPMKPPAPVTMNLRGISRLDV